MQTKKIPNSSGLVKKTDYNAKITEIEGKIPSNSCLATTTALHAVVKQNKIPNVSNLVKKTNSDAKYQTLHPNISLQLITINLQVQHLMERQKKKDWLICCCWIHKQSWFRQKKVVTLATKAVLKAEQDKNIKLQFDLI